MTEKERFVALRALVTDDVEMVEFLNRKIEQLERRANAVRKPTKVQIENDSFKAEIIAYLTVADAPKTIREMQAEIEVLRDLTNQRITHLLTDLVKAGKISKDYVKKTPYYSIAN